MPLTALDEATPAIGGRLTPLDDVAQQQGPREAHGGWDSLVSGAQGSGMGLFARGKLPDVVLDREHAKWYERALETVGSVASDLPLMVAGRAGGAFAGGAVGGPVGAVLGGGAGMMAVPTAIRESLVHAYQNGDADSSAGFLTSVSIVMKGLTEPEVLKATGKAAIVGAATLGAGRLAAPFGGAATAAAEVGTMTVAPAALEGRLPEMQDFVDAAIVVGGMKIAGRVAGKMGQIYAKTGIEPAQVVADAKVDPTLAEELKVPTPADEEPAIPKVYQAAATAEAVRNSVPDPATDPVHALDIAAVLSKPYGEVRVDKTPNWINYKYMDTPDAIKGVDARVSELYEQDFEKLRGKVGWEKNKEDAINIMSDWARDSGQPLVIPKDPKEFSKLAGRVMANKSMTERAAFNIDQAKNNILADGASADNVRELGVALAQARAIKGVRLRNDADIARAMNAMKSIKQVKALTDQYLELEEQYGADPMTLAKMIDRLRTSGQISGFANGFEELNNWQKAQQVFRFVLLSGATVFQVKGIGDIGALSERIARRYLAAGLPGSSLGEANAMMASTFQGVRDGLHAMVETWKATGQLKARDNVFGYKPTFGIEKGLPPVTGSAADIANKVIAIPHRVIAAETEFFRILNERGEMGRQAHNIAAKEGFERGTTDYDSRVTTLLRHPDKEMTDSAKLAGDEGTFTKELGKLGKLLQGVSKHDQGGFVVPFATVPANLANWAIADFPLLGAITKEAREAWAEGGEKRNMVVARQIIGATVTTLAVEAVLKGVLTGGSQWMTPQQKQTRLDAGIQDYSFKFPWSDEYHSYNRYAPLGTIAMFASDMTEVYQHASADEKADVLKMSAAVMGHAIVSQAYFEGLHQFMQALTSPTGEGARAFDSFISAWVPSFLGQAAAAHDPQRRRVDSLFDAIQQKIPLWREKLLPQVNTLTGEPLPEKRSLALSQSMQASKDPVLSEAARLGIGSSKAPKAIELPALGQKELGKVELTPEQQNIFATTSGKLAHRIMERFVNSPNWDGKSDLMKKLIYRNVLAEARKSGAAVALLADQRRLKMIEIKDKITEQLHQLETVR